jgi:hypothetical protein
MKKKIKSEQAVLPNLFVGRRRRRRKYSKQVRNFDYLGCSTGYKRSNDVKHNK